MKTFQQQPDRPEELRSRLVISEQECEQLQTALEDAEERIDRLTGENVHLRADKLSLSGEIAHLRYLLAKSNARLRSMGCWSERLTPGNGAGRRGNGAQ